MSVKQMTVRYYAPGRTFDVTYSNHAAATLAINHWIDLRRDLLTGALAKRLNDGREVMIWIGGGGIACLTDVVSVEYVEPERP